ncbi:LOW QUALITY PROTEIN: hypothetical protein AAY473_002998 [Plecturocebus cupreus]
MNEPTVQPRSQTPNRNNSYIPFQAPELLTPTPCPEENWTARPSRQYDIKKKGGEEEEGAEPKESAPSTSQSPPPDRISEAAGDCSNRAPRHGIPARPRQRTPQRGRNASETQAIVAEAHSGNRDLVGSFPTQVSKRQSRPAPPPLQTRTLSQHHNKSSPPRLLTPASRRRSQCQAHNPSPSGPVAVGSRLAPAPHSLPSGENNGESVSQRTASQTTWTHQESPRAGPPESQHQTCQSPPESTSESPTIPLGNNRGWGWEPQAGLRMLGPALL